MQKYLVTRNDENSEYHIFLATGGKKDCSVTGGSLCQKMDAEKISGDHHLSVCQAKPGTMALLSRENNICPDCVRLI